MISLKKLKRIDIHTFDARVFPVYNAHKKKDTHNAEARAHFVYTHTHRERKEFDGREVLWIPRESISISVPS